MAGMMARFTMANSAGLYPPMRATSSTKRRKVRKAKRATVKRKRVRATAKRGKRPARLVKGSAAAKRYMASIRRKRRK